jgi:hypothetical protein
MRGNNVMKGYYEDPEATAAAFAGGWFHSGDLGVMHPDGYIELRDRKKDIIISGGENISTIEVEHTLVEHPAVLECAVVAMPHEKWGEVPKAYVALRPGAQASERELIDFCRSVAHFKCRGVAFGELPKTSTGKVRSSACARRRSGREKRITAAYSRPSSRSRASTRSTSAGTSTGIPRQPSTIAQRILRPFSRARSCSSCSARSAGVGSSFTKSSRKDRR